LLPDTGYLLSLHGIRDLVADHPGQSFVPAGLGLFDHVRSCQQRYADLHAGWVQVEPTVETKRIQASGRLDLRVAG
jgi:hypothetical protein